MGVSQRVSKINHLFVIEKGKGETNMELLEQILAKENLNQAYEKVKANKGVAGVDRITVYEVDEYIKANKEKLLNQIRKRKYKPQPVKRVQIPKENGKMRNLGIPTVLIE